MKHIAFFGGSFNPIHKGHINLAKNVINSLNLDMLYFIPNSNPPHKDKLSLSFDLRSDLIKLSIKKENKIKISDIEKDPSIKHYTFNTLSRLKEQFKNDKIYFILGKDSLYNIHTWYKGFSILDICSLICIDRNEDVYNKINSNKDTINYIDKHKIILNEDFIVDKIALDTNKIIFIPCTKYDISSSNIRDNLKKYYETHDSLFLDNLKKDLDINILNKILELNLYKE